MLELNIKHFRFLVWNLQDPNTKLSLSLRQTTLTNRLIIHNCQIVILRKYWTTFVQRLVSIYIAYNYCIPNPSLSPCCCSVVVVIIFLPHLFFSYSSSSSLFFSSFFVLFFLFFFLFLFLVLTSIFFTFFVSFFIFLCMAVILVCFSGKLDYGSLPFLLTIIQQCD